VFDSYTWSSVENAVKVMAEADEDDEDED